MNFAELTAFRTTPAGRRLVSRAPTAKVAGGAKGPVTIITTPPAALAAAAGVDLETYSLARVIGSEGYGGPSLGAVAAAVVIGQCVVNECKRLGQSITAKVTGSIYPAARGWYGEQSGRYVATTRDPDGFDLEVAKAVRARSVPDLAGPARNFLAPKNWAGKATQAGKVLSPFHIVMNSWIIDSKRARRPIPSVDPWHLMVFQPGRGTVDDVRECLEIFERGLKGQFRADPGDPDSTLGASLATIAIALLGAFGVSQIGV